MVATVLTSIAGTQEDPCLHISWYLVYLLQWIHWNTGTHMQQGEEVFKLKGSTGTSINWMQEEGFRPAGLWGSGPAFQEEYYGLLVSEFVFINCLHNMEGL